MPLAHDENSALLSSYIFPVAFHSCLQASKLAFLVFFKCVTGYLTLVMSSEREKVYSRQYSAPLLKRKTSKFGLGQLLAAPQPLGTAQRSNNAHGMYCFYLTHVVLSHIFYFQA